VPCHPSNLPCPIFLDQGDIEIVLPHIFLTVVRVYEDEFTELCAISTCWSRNAKFGRHSVHTESVYTYYEPPSSSCQKQEILVQRAGTSASAFRQQGGFTPPSLAYRNSPARRVRTSRRLPGVARTDLQSLAFYQFRLQMITISSRAATWIPIHMNE